MNRILVVVSSAILLLLAGLPVAYLTWPARVPVSVAINEGAQIGGAFTLRDHHGQAVSETTYSGRWMLVFFGFTQCADICPSTLSRVARVLDGLGEQAQQLQPLFITLDPARDTPAVLAAYTTFFDSRIMGLSGSAEQTRQVAEAYRVYFEKVPLGDSYMLDHSASLYLMGPDGRFVQHYSQQLQADAIVLDMAQQMRAFRAGRGKADAAPNGS